MASAAGSGAEHLECFVDPDLTMMREGTLGLFERDPSVEGVTDLLVQGVSVKRAEALIDDVRAVGETALAIVADNSRPAGAQSAGREAAAALGGLDIPVNNAGTGWFEPG